MALLSKIGALFEKKSCGAFFGAFRQKNGASQFGMFKHTVMNLKLCWHEPIIVSVTRKCDLSQKVWFLGNWCDKISEGVIFFISQNQTFYTHLISFLDKQQTKTHQMICFVNPLLQKSSLVWFWLDFRLQLTNFGFFDQKFQAKKEFFEKLGAKKRNKKTREGHFREF